jgi:hypothetical protein
MTPPDFIAKWKRANLSERSAAQQHFLDLCDLLGQPKPAAADPDGSWYTFERGVKKSGGGKGWADVWLREHFAWEYKGKHKDLAAAYQQLLRYREDLENPPLLIVCDLDRFEVHSNFTSTAKEVYSFDLNALGEPRNLDILRKVFINPEALKPRRTTKDITEEVAARFAKLADGMRERHVPAPEAAHFLMKLMFCMFAEDIGLLPEWLFTKVLTSWHTDPLKLALRLGKLFGAMASGGEFGADTLLHFNGGLFADARVLELTRPEIDELMRVNECDWSNVEPSIFGTLFERTLDPTKRSQIGAHYTSKEDILTLLEPVLMAPLRREWEEVKAKCEKLWRKVQQAAREGTGRSGKGFRQSFEKVLADFGHRLGEVKVFDPACGSGNFLYVAINLLLDLEKQVISYASQHAFSWFPHVRPTQLAGLEINPYAQQLAQVVIWIGYLQWMHHNGFKAPSDPVLEPIENVRLMDAILDLSDPESPREPDWPEAEFIVGNPPFLGNKLMRSKLGSGYCEALWNLYGDRLPGMSDLCCYWFEKARATIERGTCRRAGLLATTGIKQVGARRVLERICGMGRIFFAESDRDWVLEGANVRIVMVGFSANADAARVVLDGEAEAHINPDLTAGTSVTRAVTLAANRNLCFMGTTKVGAFDISHDLALSMLGDPNPHGLPNSDVIRPIRNGSDLVQVSSNRWIIDFGVDRTEEESSCYVAPLEFILQNVKPERVKNTQNEAARNWWLFARSRPGFRQAVTHLARYIATARVAKHRLFVWLDTVVLPDSKVIAIALEDDYHFGVLNSRIHATWSLKYGSKHGGERPTYNPDTCFLPFPFPSPPNAEGEAVAVAARALDCLRSNWLNPPEWTKTETLEFPGSVDGPWKRYVHEPDARGIGMVRFPRTVAKDAASAAKLKKRTLTNLYNEMPTLLKNAHAALDAAVFTAYGWKPDMTDEEILAALLALNLERAAKQAAPP